MNMTLTHQSGKKDLIPSEKSSDRSVSHDNKQAVPSKKCFRRSLS